MRLIKKSTTDRSSKEISRNMAIYEGVTARAIFGLVSGAFIAGFLKYMGADDGTSGRIIALPVLAYMIQFISPVFIENMNWKKKMIMTCCTIHRALLVLLVFIPLLPISVSGKLWITGTIYFLSFMILGFVVPALSNMYVNFVPTEQRGSYFAIRERYILIYSVVITLIMGRILDHYESGGNLYGGYIFIFAVVLLNTVLNTLSFWNMREVRIRPSKSRFRIRDVFLIPLRDKSFRIIIILFLLWGAGFQSGAAYFSVYMVSKLELSYTFITFCALVLAVFYLLSTRFWGRLGDRSGWITATIGTFLILGMTHFLWFFVFDAWHMYILIVLLHAASGIAWGGINISLFNVQFDYIPKEGRTLYLGFNGALSGVVGYLAALLASSLVGNLENWRISVLGMPVGIMQLIFAFSGTVIMLTGLYVYKAVGRQKRHA